MMTEQEIDFINSLKALLQVYNRRIVLANILISEQGLFLMSTRVVNQNELLEYEEASGPDPSNDVVADKDVPGKDSMNYFG